MNSNLLSILHRCQVMADC